MIEPLTCIRCGGDRKPASGSMCRHCYTLPKWLDGTNAKDWYFNGMPLRAKDADLWRDLDWSRAWMDMGPSPAGNGGPYWHVPRKSEDGLWARLYPKFLKDGKWTGVLERAIEEARNPAAAEKGESGE